MPQLPEDIIDRLTQMERRIQALSTAVNTRPALNEIADGAFIVKRPNADGTSTALLQVGKWNGDEYGLSIHRQTGEQALALYNGNGSGTAKQVLRINDAYGHEIFSDDITAGGLARPWLQMLPPQDLASANWCQTTSTAWTTIARSHNPIWQPRMRLAVYTRVSSGATGQVKILVDGVQWGPTVNGGTHFDHTAPIVADIQSKFGHIVNVEIQAMVTTTTGTVYAQPYAMYGLQS
ncbi:hypothetical protein ABZ958_30985 [Streptomyces sp. NPDC046237]|uniref:hypothetical protein n=1 Tax=Streptomyces sp. NPDC046237 TaxID=3154914 RepID=UPI0033F06AED